MTVIDDNPRLIELRRRVQGDPASIAFAQLAEEYRRGGEAEQAIDVCRAGLMHHPGYLSARVTLGRALLELGRLDEAQAELEIVLAAAPDNLAANRALAEVHQKKGELTRALALYRRALELAKFDPELEHEVQKIESVVSPPPPPEPKVEPQFGSIEDLFDFDALLEQLGSRPDLAGDRTIEPPAQAPAPAAPSAPPLAEAPANADDPFSRLERQLREVEEARAYQPIEPLPPEPVVAARHVEEAPHAPSPEQVADQRVLGELETWLTAIVTDRAQRFSA